MLVSTVSERAVDFFSFNGKIPSSSIRIWRFYFSAYRGLKRKNRPMSLYRSQIIFQNDGRWISTIYLISKFSEDDTDREGEDRRRLEREKLLNERYLTTGERELSYNLEKPSYHVLYSSFGCNWTSATSILIIKKFWPNEGM